jgi:peptidyl-prolyl cis-trans isomerase SurA
MPSLIFKPAFLYLLPSLQLHSLRVPTLRVPTLLVPTLRVPTLLVLVLLAWTGPVWAQSNDQFLDRIVIIVGDDVITEREVVGRIRLADQQIRQLGLRPPDRDTLIRQVTEQIVTERVQLQEAERLGIRIDELSLNRTVASVAAENNLSLLQLRNALAAEGIEFTVFRQQIRDEMTIAQLRRRQVDNRLRVTDQEIDELIASESGAIDREIRYRISHILVRLPSGADSEVIAETARQVRAIRERALAGEDFATLAITYSNAPDALQGGDLGWRSAGDIPTLYARAAVLLNPGDISGVLRSPEGFHLVRLTEREAGQDLLVQQTRARHILVGPNQLRSLDDARQQAESLYRRIQAGADFAELARANSDDPGSAARGGLLGWVGPGELVDVFEETMNGLRIGEMSEPVLSEFGWHIIEVLERRELDASREVIRARAREILRNRKSEDELARWLRQLRDAAYVEYRIEGLAPQ